MIFRALAPSNIAFLKYWGKRDAALQWPANDSLSMTLNNLATQTDAYVHAAADHAIHYQGQAYDRGDRRFSKSYRHLDHLAQRFGFREKLHIETSNSFPMGAGIASSASGFAALTLASLSAWTKSRSLADLQAADFSPQLLAQLARQGSGSAGRSLFGGIVRWSAGETPDTQLIEAVYEPDHWALCDSVVLFSTEEKSKSSTAAHADAWSSPLFRPRLAGVPDRMQAMLTALQRRSMSALGPLLEAEALEMHAVMMTAQVPQNYLSEAALDFLVALREERRQSQLAAYFTIDAGPNIHIIHTQDEHMRLRAWLEGKFPKSMLLHDTVGSGPRIEGWHRE